MIEWLQQHKVLFYWMGIVSAVSVVVSLVAIPMIVVRLPPDYFSYRRRVQLPRTRQHPVLRLVAMSLKNLLGATLVLAGILMLVLPGQGVLTILIGLMVMDFPGKFALERRIVRQRQVLKALNWIRRKADRLPLRV